MQEIFESCGTEGLVLSWKGLAYEAWIENVLARTVQKAMGMIEYHQCVAYKKGSINDRTAKHCMKNAKIMLERNLDRQHWLHVRFSDEVHFLYGDDPTTYDIQKPGQRLCNNCCLQKPPSNDKETQRVYKWAAVDYDFKTS